MTWDTYKQLCLKDYWKAIAEKHENNVPAIAKEADLDLKQVRIYLRRFGVLGPASDKYRPKFKE